MRKVFAASLASFVFAASLVSVSRAQETWSSWSSNWENPATTTGRSWNTQPDTGGTTWSSWNTTTAQPTMNPRRDDNPFTWSATNTWNTTNPSGMDTWTTTRTTRVHPAASGNSFETFDSFNNQNVQTTNTFTDPGTFNNFHNTSSTSSSGMNAPTMPCRVGWNCSPCTTWTWNCCVQFGNCGNCWHNSWDCIDHDDDTWPQPEPRPCTWHWNCDPCTWNRNCWPCRNGSYPCRPCPIWSAGSTRSSVSSTTMSPRRHDCWWWR